MLSQGLTLTSLGSGSTIPQHRHPAATHVRIDGDEYLIDAPEGVQQRLFEYDLGLSLDSIFITNDSLRSILGLPGLVNTLSFWSDRTKPLKIYCPPGVITKIREVIDWFEVSNYTISVEEVIPGQSEFGGERYKMTTIDNPTYNSYGILIEEANVRGTFNREKAENLGVPPGPKFQELCDGESVEAEDGTIVEPEQVLGEAPDSIKVVFTGRGSSVEDIIEIGQGTQAIVQEATITEDRIDVEGRSSLSDAARVAADVNPNVILLTRILNRFGYKPDREIEEIVQGEVDSSINTHSFSSGTRVNIKRGKVEIHEP